MGMLSFRRSYRPFSKAFGALEAAYHLSSTLLTCIDSFLFPVSTWCSMGDGARIVFLGR